MAVGGISRTANHRANDNGISLVQNGGAFTKIASILGTRPEIIRLSKIIPKLDAVCEHTLIHTGQNYDENMSGIFFEELGIRKPDYFLGIGGGTFEDQLGQLGVKLRDVFDKVQPERLLVLGDTNSGLSAFFAKRRHIKVYHMEAGNRCFNDTVPEEPNRRTIDTNTDVFLPYTERARDNLLQEGIPPNRIYVTGNPIYEVLLSFSQDTDVCGYKGLNTGLHDYFLVTAHREENVDNQERLRAILMSCIRLDYEYHLPIYFSLHPRTANRIKEFKLEANCIKFHEPFGLLDFLTLERHAKCVITDSGTVQEECCILKVPVVTLRDNTERPETIDSGANILAGVCPSSVSRAVKIALSQPPSWIVPPEYLRTNVSDTVVKIVTGF